MQSKCHCCCLASPLDPLHASLPRWLERSNQNKNQKTTAASLDPCCPCSLTSTCSSRNCLCAKAVGPCQDCNPGAKCCKDIAAHDQIIVQASLKHGSSIATQFCWLMGGAPLLPIPLIPDPNRNGPSYKGDAEANNNRTSRKSTTAVGGGNAASSNATTNNTVDASGAAGGGE